MFGIGAEVWVAAIGGAAVIILWELMRPTVRRAPAATVRLCRWGLRHARRKVIDPLWLARQRQLHGVRIELMSIRTLGEYGALPDKDQVLFRRLRPRDHHALFMADLREFLDTKPEWQLEAEAKAGKAALSHQVYTKSGSKLECWNCAFFVADLKEVRGKLERNPYGGECYKTKPPVETDPSGFCGSHSALQRFHLSEAGRYNIAPVE